MNQQEAREYLRGAAERWIEGVRLQVRRCEDQSGGDVFLDSNFLVVAVTRLREVARMVRDRLRDPAIGSALDRFDAQLPEFRDVRDYQEHILDPALIGSAMYFAGGELSRLRADGGIDVLIDPGRLATAAEEFYSAICQVLGPVPEPAKTWTIRPPKKRKR